MKTYLTTFSLIALPVLICITGCKKDNDDKPQPIENTPPVAVAGNDTTIYFPDNIVKLDATASHDSESSIVDYEWTIISGPYTGHIYTPYASKAEAYGLLPGTYEIQLSVKDLRGLKATDKFKVTVEERTCGSSMSEVVLRDLKWIVDPDWEGWGMYIYIFEYLPVKGNFKQVFIRRNSSSEWESANTHAFYSDYGEYHYTYMEGVLGIYPSDQDRVEDRPDVKLVYCN